MIRSAAFVCLMLLIFLFPISVRGQAKAVFFKEDFNDLENWRPLNFPKIKKHSVYTIEKERDNAFLRTESDASASGLIFKKEYSVYDYPRVRWRWKVDNVYQKGNAEEKSGDDYPVRIYIIFKYDPGAASFGQRLKYGLARKLYGEYPPHSSLNYVWASKKHQKRIIANPYAAEAKMVFLEAGPDKVGQWVEEEVDVIEDYEKAFGTKPPAVASIAVMNDSDNTGERSVSYVDYIEVFRRPAMR
jgi:hypothetical protein